MKRPPFVQIVLRPSNLFSSAMAVQVTASPPPGGFGGGAGGGVNVLEPRADEVLRRIHCEDGPAIKLDNARVLYFWHGIHVPEWVIMAPETIDLDDILKERNLELRRVLIERFGKGRFLSALGGDREMEDKYGILWKIDRERFMDMISTSTIAPYNTPNPKGKVYLNWHDAHLVDELFGKRKVAKFVEVKDASTPRIYFLQVPARIKTAKEGVAWTFGKKVEEYEPQKEA